MLPLRGHRETNESLNKGNFLELMDLRSKDNSTLKCFSQCKDKYVTYTSHNIQDTVLEIMASNIRNQILLEVKSCKSYPFIMDETQDISRHEQCAVVLCYVTENLDVKESFFGFHRVTHTDGETLSTDSISFL